MPSLAFLLFFYFNKFINEKKVMKCSI